MIPKIFVTRRIPEAGLSMLMKQCRATIWPDDLPPSREDMLENVPGIQGLLCLLTDPVDAQIIAAAGSNLRVISTYAVGFDNIDVDFASKRQIPVGNTPGVLTETTADLAFALIMAAARRIVEGARFARAGRWLTWSPTLLLGQDVYGATLGIVGMGRIGCAVARRAAGFGMKVIYTDRAQSQNLGAPGAERVTTDELFSRSDFLSLHAPLTDETANMVNRRTLGLMKPTAVLINTARGGMVDHDALYEALKNGELGCAGLDVTDPEPLPSGHCLYDLSNCLIVPHLGSASVQTRDRMATIAARNLLAGLAGERLPHCVNPQIYG